MSPWKDAGPVKEPGWSSLVGQLTLPAERVQNGVDPVLRSRHSVTR